MDPLEKKLDAIIARLDSTQHVYMQLQKSINDVLLIQELSDIAICKRIRYTGPVPANTTAQSWQDKGNPVKVPGYVFIPRTAEKGKKYPLLVFIHGGVHSNFGTHEGNIVREMVLQGYVVVAPDYRGSTGYGEPFWKLIDYGGLEVEDTYEARNWMVENEPLVDKDRIGIIGWSHGGLHTLMNIFNHPEAYKVAYAGVPVSDLVARMGYKGDAYRTLFAADYHIGKTADQDPWEYKKRSPAWNAHKLQTPLLIHTTTNDEDVNCLEVEHLIKALKAEGKDFQYKIYDNAPGGHAFEAIDTKYAQDCRKEIWAFLAKYLKPENPMV